ncbi:hypothetical protein IKB17_02435 [bacterium]|nr:hypothetical protein [bacterium]
MRFVKNDFHRIIRFLSKHPEINNFIELKANNFANTILKSIIMSEYTYEDVIKVIPKIIEYYKNDLNNDNWDAKFKFDPDTYHTHVQVNDNITVFDFNGNVVKHRKYFKNNDGSIIEEVISNKKQIESTSNWFVQTDYLNLEDFFDKLESSSKTVKDNNGNILYKEYYEKSSNIPNKYNVWRENREGKRFLVGLAEKSPAGEMIIEKSLTSDSGIKTEYVIIEDLKGQRISKTKITNKDGDILIDINHKFKQINENHFISEENGVKYDIKYLENKVVVTRDDGEIAEVSIGENGVISNESLYLTKLLPGSIYFDIKKYCLNKIEAEIDTEYGFSQGTYSNRRNIISLVNADLFTLLHELGHYRCISKEIYKNQELLKIYEEERREFIETSPEEDIKQLDYFVTINPEHLLDRSIHEVIAEIYAILYSINTASCLELRGEYLQKYFPRTFAKAAELLLNSSGK